MRTRAVVALAACVAAVASGCAVALPLERGGLGGGGCRAGADSPAGGDRTAALFVRSHVSVGEDGLGITYGAHFVQLAPRLVAAVNGYLRARQAGIVLVARARVPPFTAVRLRGGPEQQAVTTRTTERRTRRIPTGDMC